MRTSLFKTLAFAALAVFAGAALAQPDFAAAVWQFMTPDMGAALAFGPMVRALQEKHNAELAAMSTFGAIAAERELTTDEQTKFDAHKAAAASLKARIATAQEAELAEAGMSAARVVDRPAASTVTVTDNQDADPQRGFKSFG